VNSLLQRRVSDW